MTLSDKTVADTLENSDWEQVCALALWMHEAESVEELQRGTLDRLAGLVCHRVSMFDLIELDEQGGVRYVSPLSTTMEPAALSEYYRHYAAQDYTTWSFDLHEVNVYRDLDLVDVARRDATPIYREWMEPQGVYFGCTATLAHGGAPLGTITLFREHEAGDFSPREMRMLKEAARHTSAALARILASTERESGRGAGRENGNRTRGGADAQALATPHGLNPREVEVLELMFAGHTNREMAEALFISESTVKKHVNAVYRKLGVRNRMELAGLLR